MLLSDADRERLLDALTQHAAAGRLDLSELERRVEAIVNAGSREEAAAVMADLPPLARDVAPRPRPRRGRGHGDAEVAAPDWSPTNERFRDPRTSRVMRVWVDSAGARYYVPEAGPRES